MQLGVDIGGTKILAGLVDETGAVLRSIVGSTPAVLGPSAVLDAAAHLARRAGGEERLSGCGVGTAGTVAMGGVITAATDALPGWRGTDVRRELSARLGLPVAVVNDVHAAALGEARHGAAQDATTVLVCMVGTGIGGGIVRNGELELGAHGAAGAIGHVPSGRTEGRQCPCGGIDHIEAYASGPALAAAAGVTRVEDVSSGADVIADGGRLLGAVLGGIANVVDPDVVVIGGGVALVGDRFLEPLESAYRSAALVAPASAAVRKSTLGQHAVVVGAASLVQTRGGTCHERSAQSLRS